MEKKMEEKMVGPPASKLDANLLRLGTSQQRLCAVESQHVTGGRCLSCRSILMWKSHEHKKKTGRQTALGFTRRALCKKASPPWWECGDVDLARQSSSDLCAGGAPSSPGPTLAGGRGFGPPQWPDSPHGLKSLLRLLILSRQPQSCALIQTPLRLVPNTPRSRDSLQQ